MSNFFICERITGEPSGPMNSKLVNDQLKDSILGWIWDEVLAASVAREEARWGGFRLGWVGVVKAELAFGVARGITAGYVVGSVDGSGKDGIVSEDDGSEGMGRCGWRSDDDDAATGRTLRRRWGAVGGRRSHHDHIRPALQHSRVLVTARSPRLLALRASNLRHTTSQHQHHHYPANHLHFSHRFAMLRSRRSCAISRFDYRGSWQSKHNFFRWRYCW